MARSKRVRDDDDITHRFATRARLPAYLERLPTELWLDVRRPVSMLQRDVTRSDKSHSDLGLSALGVPAFAFQSE